MVNDHTVHGGLTFSLEGLDLQDLLHGDGEVVLGNEDLPVVCAQLAEVLCDQICRVREMEVGT